MQLPDFSKVRILVFGDVMLDQYVHGTVDRISPEAPAPIFNKADASNDCRLGGAANVAANIAALGAKVEIVGVVGLDSRAYLLRAMLGEAGIEAHLFTDDKRPTTTKTRYVAGGHQILRVDQESTDDIWPEISSLVETRLSISAALADAIIISDYAKGTVTHDAFEVLMDCQKPIYAAPKKELRFYKGAACIVPNLSELSRFTNGFSVDTDEQIYYRLREAHAMTGAAILVTRGADGMTLCSSPNVTTTIGSVARQVFDVSGAGDTVIATFAASIAAGADPDLAIKIANIAAGIVVGKQGTSVVPLLELSDEVSRCR